MQVAVLLSALAVLVAVVIGLDRLPPQHSPFAPLDLEHPVGFATGLKLSRLRDDFPRCLDVLDRAELQARPLPDRREGAFCAIEDAVSVERSSVPYSAPVQARCALAAALYVWERQVVAPAAVRHFGSPLARIEHAGTYACRRVYGSASGRPSEHATANAIDITGFRLADGQRVSVLRGWTGSAAERAFLREVHAGACPLFRAVLGPTYNAAHRDHFHLDMGAFNACR